MAGKCQTVKEVTLHGDVTTRRGLDILAPAIEMDRLPVLEVLNFGSLQNDQYSLVMEPGEMICQLSMV